MQQARWDHTRIPQQTGKQAVVTGANSGLGWHISLQLARQGAHVVMACRDKARAMQAMDAIRAEVPHARLSFQALDLASLHSVRACAAALAAAHPRIDLLVNNAGVMFLPYALSADGFELQMACNHLGHFLLTGLLLPQLAQAPAPRIVTMSSGFNHYGRLPQEGFKGQPSYSRHRAYCDTKLANIVFARELATRLARAGSHIASVAAHPGYAATNLQFGAANLSEARWLAGLSRASRAAITSGRMAFRRHVATPGWWMCPSARWRPRRWPASGSCPSRPRAFLMPTPPWQASPIRWWCVCVEPAGPSRTSRLVRRRS